MRPRHVPVVRGVEGAMPPAPPLPAGTVPSPQPLRQRDLRRVAEPALVLQSWETVYETGRGIRWMGQVRCNFSETEWRTIRLRLKKIRRPRDPTRAPQSIALGAPGTNPHT